MSRCPPPPRCPRRTAWCSGTTARYRSAPERRPEGANVGRKHCERGGCVRILVTGGAGFIGSHYVRTMLMGGYPGYEDAAVTVLDNLTYAGNPANLAQVPPDPRLRFGRGDIADADLVRSLVPGHDAVINFAAETHVDRSISGAAPFVVTYGAGVQALLQHVAPRGR